MVSGQMVAFVAGMGLVGSQLAARRSGISLRAWILFKLAKFMAPDLSSPKALQKAILKDRARGPALPSSRLRRRINFRDEMWGTDRVFCIESRNKPPSAIRILYLHGSGYVFDLHKAQWNLIWGLIARTDAKVIAPLYPLAPEHSWQDGLEMVKRTYIRLIQQGNAEKIIIVGDSAGGGLALILAQFIRDASLPAPAGVVLFSPWLDVSVSGKDQPEIALRDPALTINFLQTAGLMWANGIATNNPCISPLFGSHENLPPTILFTGGRDILDSDAKRLSHVSNKITISRYQEMMHVWPVAPIPEAKRALDEAAAFIYQALQVNSVNI